MLLHRNRVIAYTTVSTQYNLPVHTCDSESNLKYYDCQDEART